MTVLKLGRLERRGCYLRARVYSPPHSLHPGDG
jgi:hypothetical protein